MIDQSVSQSVKVDKPTMSSVQAAGALMRVRQVSLVTVTRYVVLVASVLMMVLGIVALVTGSYPVGAITVVESLLIPPVELFSAPTLFVTLSPAAAMRYRPVHNFLQHYAWRAGFYVAFSIVTFFSNFTIAAGVLLLIGAVAYIVAELGNGQVGPMIEADGSTSATKKPMAMSDVLAKVSGKEEAASGL